MTEALYADGGCISINPSPLGGTYGWALTRDDVQVQVGSGVITPSALYAQKLGHIFWPDPKVSNNASEFIALVLAMEAVPEGWHGDVCSDSQVTLGRLTRSWKISGIPSSWVARGLVARNRLDLARCQIVLLDGHPTKAQLEAGVGKRGHPVSVHNRWCDSRCAWEATKFMSAIKGTPFLKEGLKEIERMRLAYLKKVQPPQPAM